MADILRDLQSAKDGKLLTELTGKSEIRCKICNSPGIREKVERFVVAGFPYRAIAEDIQGTDPKFNGRVDTIRKGIERHVHRHMNIKDKAVRQIIENRAREEGILVDEVKHNLATAESLLELYVQKGLEQVTEEGSRVKHADILEAAKMLRDIKKESYVQELEVLQRQVWAISQAVKEMIPAERHVELVTRARQLFDQPILEMEAARG